MNYLSNKSQIETSLRYLESVGLPVGDLWTAHQSRLDAYDDGKPSEDDLRYEVPSTIPAITTHLDGGNEVLEPSRLWGGYSYSLTTGQRSWLKDNFNLTPTRTVTVIDISVWPETRHPRQLRIRSDLHVDPRNRRHVLVAATINKVGRFFREAEQRTIEHEQELVKVNAKRDAKLIKAGITSPKLTLVNLLKSLEEVGI